MENVIRFPERGATRLKPTSSATVGQTTPFSPKDGDGVREQHAKRKKAWRKARARAEFLEASLRWNDAVLIAQDCGIPEAKSFERLQHGDPRRYLILDTWREALGHQLLTPAPDLASVQWKRRARRHYSGDIPAHRFDEAIEDDLAWLAKYPASQRRVRQPPE